MFLIYENFRDFENGGDFPKDFKGRYVRCDGCADLAEQYLIMENKAYCKGCLERGIRMLNKNFMNHCVDSWNKRLIEENGRF